MFALCIEASHAFGMGHLYRAMNLVRALGRAGQTSVVLVNSHEPSLRVLESAGIGHAEVDLADFDNDWEGRLVADLGIHVWVNDRLDTDERHAAKVKRLGIPLATLDDRGSGAVRADLNIAALAFDAAETLPGRRVLRGLAYLVLDSAIERFRRLRQCAEQLLVTLGGSDTHGVTVTVVRHLRATGRSATVIVGPGFQHQAELDAVAGEQVRVKRDVPSLIPEFEHYDLAITGGGITPFEANASGLPCVIIANELFEIPNARELERLGSSVFAGHQATLDPAMLTCDLPVERMSRAGMEGIDLGGADRVATELLAL